MIYLTEKNILPLVQQVATQYGVPPALVLAHVKQESAFNHKAYRAEPAINDASYGLMQVLLKTAKTIDPNATANLLYNPEYNLRIGTAYIAQNLKKYSLLDAIAAYNAGTPRKNTSGQYVNSKGTPNVQDYVSKVHKNYIAYSNWLGEGAPTVSINPFLAGAFVLAGFVTLVLIRRKRNERNRT